jgi:multidrug efflux pump subunit AcrA (membrane-fusion protein)
MTLGRLLGGTIAVLLVAGACAAAWWILEAKPAVRATAPSSPPAVAVSKVSEEDMGKLILSEEGERRLGVETALVARRSVRQVRIYGGEVIAPVGRTILVAAPVGGTLRASERGVPLIGSRVTKGQVLFQLLPLLSPEASTNFTAAKVDAEGQVNNARTQLEMSKLALARADRLLKGEAGSKRALEETQAQHDTALRSLEAAESRFAVLTKAVGAAATGFAAPMPIEAPENGILRNVLALPDQNVPGSAPLFEVVDLGQVWIRVPIYVGDLASISESDPAEVGNLNRRSTARVWPAMPVDAPPSANPQAFTVDRYFSLDNGEADLTPGERVWVTILLNGNNDSLTVPASAVVFDIQGDTWVYRRLAPRTYKRARVLLRHFVEDVAVLASGPPVDAEIVTAGAQELFGAETGFSK